MNSDPYVIFYDAHCELCRRTRQWLEQHQPAVPMRFVDVSDPQALAQWPQIDPQSAKYQMLVLDPDRNVTAGYDAALTLLNAFLPAARHLQPFLRLTPFRWLGQNLYLLIARNRHRLMGN